MDIVIFDESRRPVSQFSDYTLDMAYGYGDDTSDGENDFTLSYPMAYPRLRAGCWWHIDGTGYGGVVDSISSTVTDGTAMLEYSGRTWSGVLKSKILAPDDGQDYWSVSGSAMNVIQALLDRVGLDSVFTADGSDMQVQYDFRYQDAYTGLRLMLQSSGLKPVMRPGGNGMVTISAMPVETFSDVVDSDLMDFSSQRDFRPINHLIGLGEGELRNRARSDWYADKDGNVSQNQSLFGLDERSAVYDYTNSKADELAKSTEKKLKELQSKGTIDVKVHAGHEFEIGDVVTAANRDAGIDVTASVVKKIVTVKNGAYSCDYEVGLDTTVWTTGLSGGVETSAGTGGAVYSAGAGLKLVGYTFIADVTADDLTQIRQSVDTANKNASDALAAVGRFQLATDTDIDTVVFPNQ